MLDHNTENRTDELCCTVMNRPFGFNEFDGAGGGYLIKFASLFDGKIVKLCRFSFLYGYALNTYDIVSLAYVIVDENVVVGSSPATAGKTSITDYGSSRC